MQQNTRISVKIQADKTEASTIRNNNTLERLTISYEPVKQEEGYTVWSHAINETCVNTTFWTS